MATKTPKPQVKVDARVVLGHRVRSLRIEANMTQQALADRCKFFRTYLSRIEHGTANATVTVLAALAVALNVEIGDLFNG